jgi:hypothetical protein
MGQLLLLASRGEVYNSIPEELPITKVITKSEKNGRETGEYSKLTYEI